MPKRIREETLRLLSCSYEVIALIISYLTSLTSLKVEVAGYNEPSVPSQKKGGGLPLKKDVSACVLPAMLGDKE